MGPSWLTAASERTSTAPRAEGRTGTDKVKEHWRLRPPNRESGFSRSSTRTVKTPQPTWPLIQDLSLKKTGNLPCVSRWTTQELCESSPKHVDHPLVLGCCTKDAVSVINPTPQHYGTGHGPSSKTEKCTSHKFPPKCFFCHFLYFFSR